MRTASPHSLAVSLIAGLEVSQDVPDRNAARPLGERNRIATKQLVFEQRTASALSSPVLAEGNVEEKADLNTIVRAAELANDVPLARPAPYFLSSELSEKPRPQGEIVLAYPSSENNGEHVSEGRLVLHLYISEEGSVVDAITELSTLPEPFEKATIAQFRDARFTPGRIDGLPVRSLIRIEVTLGADDAGMKSGSAG